MEGNPFGFSDSFGLDLKPGKFGGISDKSPTNFSWHYGQEDGVMQLVSRKEHQKGGTHHEIMHEPNGSGWFSTWGIK